VLFQVVTGTYLQVILVDEALLMLQIHLLVHLDMFHLVEVVFLILLKVCILYFLLKNRVWFGAVLYSLLFFCINA
jgi:hypothetical protein